ncbi:MAG: ComEC/Rec2 family competence protein [Chloracidobacterium sp.]|nr:ComEC/Rec2 family competence protein [Chloracidobacterium sp.]
MESDATRPSFNRHPMLWLAVCFAAGVLIAKFITVGFFLTLVAAAALLILTLIFRTKSIATIFISIAFIAGGTVLFQCEVKQNSDKRIKTLYDNGLLRSGSPVEIEGVLLGRPEPSADGAFLTFKSTTLRYRGNDRIVSGNVRIFLPHSESEISNLKSEISNLKYGSRIRAACNLEREDEYLNPGVLPKREMLDRLGIDATCSLKSSVLVEHIADESVFLPLAWVYDQRAALIDDLRNGLSRPAAGVMIASLLGDKYFLDKDTADLFRDGGTFHILVISGLHITFIGGLLLVFLRWFTRNRWLQFGVTTTILWGYTLAVGADVPVVRAAIMFTVVLFAYAIYRRGTLLNSLGFCGLVLLAWRPTELFDPSFQLTFVSVAAIVAIAYPLIEHLRAIGSWSPIAATPFPPNVPNWLRRFCETIYWNNPKWSIESKRQIWSAHIFKSPYFAGRVGETIQKIFRYVFEGLLISLIVQVCMLPLSVIYFHRVSVASVLLNLWVSIFIAVESFAAVIGALIGHISTLLAAPFFAVAEVMNWLMLSVPRLFAMMDWASFRLPAYTGAGRVIYGVYFVPLILLAVAIMRWKPFELKAASRFLTRRFLYPVIGSALVLIAIIVLHPFSVAKPDGRLHIDFLDVGQGDAALITFPDGKTLLVDGGGRFDYRKKDGEAEPFERDTRGIGESVVSEVLWAKGYSSIDAILTTHADADHIQGLTDVAKNFGIGTALFARTPTDDLNFNSLADVLKRRRVPVEIVARGDRLNFGDVTVEPIYPAASDDPNAVSDNNNSIVLRIIYGNRTFLLTGDIERQAEMEILNSGGTFNADLIKVPHHGSRTSSTVPFVDAVKAKYAIVSVGRNSPFGHPHPEVIERWNAAGATVKTTGEKGMISVSTDGKDIEIKTFLP